MTREDAINEIKSWSIPSKNSREVLETLIPELRESKDERILKKLIEGFENYSRDLRYFNDIDVLDILVFLEKQENKKYEIIQWTGDNLKEVIKFTGKSPMFGKWFKSWEEYEEYVHSHGNIFKLFNDDGSHYEVPVGAWIVKTPDGHNVPLETQKEQKPDIELIQQSWYMEGYKDREHNRESKWIVKTGEGGPKYETNPKYGQSLIKEQKLETFNEPYDPDECEVVIEGNAISLKRKEQKPIEDVVKDITKNKESAIKFLKSAGIMDDNGELAEMYRSESNPVEWSKEDELIVDAAIYWLKKVLSSKEVDDILTDDCPISIRKTIDRLKLLRPQPKQEWSEEDEAKLRHALFNTYAVDTATYLFDKARFIRPSWKPSEQEKSAIRTAISILTDRGCPKTAEQLQDILDAFEGKESRKDWKPSEEQMAVLERFLNYLDEIGSKDYGIMYSFLEQLDKL